MKYALLIYEKADYRESVSSEAWEKMMGEHTAFWEKYGSTKVVGGDALDAHHTATSLRNRGGDYQVTDGPFVETREILGGFYIAECANLDEAIAIAREIPVEEGEGIEIRPVITGE